jgi:hypothetical protein
MSTKKPSEDASINYILNGSPSKKVYMNRHKPSQLLHKCIIKKHLTKFQEG